MVGSLTKWRTYGCNDADGDGYADSDDDFITDGTQWTDSDSSDGYGDEPTGTILTCALLLLALIWTGLAVRTVILTDTLDPDPTGTNGPAWTELDGATCCLQISLNG